MTGAKRNDPAETIQNDIDTVADSPTTHTLRDGTQVQIGRVKVRHLSHMMVIVKKIFEKVGAKDSGEVSVDLSSPAVVLDILQTMPDDATAMVAMLTDLPVAVVGDLDADEGIELLKKVLQVNISFFEEKVMPAALNLIAVAAASMQKGQKKAT